MQAHKAPETYQAPEEQIQCPDPACHKITLCRYNQLGCCRKGNACSFAHDPSELKAFDPARRWSQQVLVVNFTEPYTCLIYMSCNRPLHDFVNLLGPEHFTLSDLYAQEH